MHQWHVGEMPTANYALHRASLDRGDIIPAIFLPKAREVRFFPDRHSTYTRIRRVSDMSRVFDSFVEIEKEIHLCHRTHT